MLDYSQIANPKRHLDLSQSDSRKLFPYYAGFSSAFVESTLDSICLPAGAKIFDPWNGSGTTTTAAFKRGFDVVGSDLNPAMILVAKAAFVSKLDIESLVPIAHSIAKKNITLSIANPTDPLCNWLEKNTAQIIRKLEISINRILISPSSYLQLHSTEALQKVTPLAAFFYLALFKVMRQLTQTFVASNPTWIKTSKSNETKIAATKKFINELFIKEVELLSFQHMQVALQHEKRTNNVELLLSNAENLPLECGSVDAIITSPPYCTRIDYAIATYVELATLGIGGESFSNLRRSLTGSSTVSSVHSEIKEQWGEECGTFLNALQKHPSKASSTYYLKNHLQYFESLYKSLSEASRVMRTGAPCVLVVQNSYYKEIRNDIAKIIIEMANSISLKLTHQADFSASRSMVDLNKNSKKYISNRSTIESVIFLAKEPSI
ncbi:DNA methylase [Pseudomonas sp. PD9R]|nr:DNA methylase [Pseudomonas sp. PD9R]